MRHTATPPLVLEIGQKLWQYCHFYTTFALGIRVGEVVFLLFGNISITAVDRP